MSHDYFRAVAWAVLVKTTLGSMNNAGVVVLVAEAAAAERETGTQSRLFAHAIKSAFKRQTDRTGQDRALFAQLVKLTLGLRDAVV